MVLVRLEHFAVLPELSLTLHLSPPHCFAAERARLTAPGTASCAVRISHRQFLVLECFARFLVEDAPAGALYLAHIIQTIRRVY
jgi:hypothetical protein